MSSTPWLFHITFDGTLPSTLKPQLPAGTELKNQGVLKEFNEPRVSFAPCVFNCLQAIIPNVWKKLFSEEGQKNGVDFHVYRMKSDQDVRIKTPHELTHERLVWDAHITHEYCVLDPVEIVHCGKVNAKVDKSDPGLTIYPYNDKKLKPEHNKLCEDATFKLLQRPQDEEHRIVLFGQHRAGMSLESRPLVLDW